MTQIITMSAATAAYAAEGLRPSARTNGTGASAENTYVQTLEARKADKLRYAQMANTIGPAALGLFYLTAGERRRSQQQATMREVAEAYFGDPSDDEEAIKEDEEHETEHVQSAILALPAPEDIA